VADALLRIVTERLELSPLTEADAEDVFAYARNANVARMTSWKPHGSVNDALAFIRQIKTTDQLVWALRLGDGRAIGTIDYSHVRPGVGHIDYALAEEHWGKGLMTEAARAVVDWAFHEYPSLAVMRSGCLAENRRSRRVMEKCGMHLVKAADDLVHYALTRKLFIRSSGASALPDLDPELRLIDMSDNPIGELPERLGRVSRLEVLYAARLKLTALPDCIGDLATLRYLDVGENPLGSLPDVLARLGNLWELHIEANGLTTLPPLPPSLRELHARRNLIDSIPDHLAALERLELLDLRVNRLATVPDWLADLPSLRKLDLRGNPLTRRPACADRLLAAGAIVYL
jgi:RimJ/RimL family protein N-acetyltransferase